MSSGADNQIRFCIQREREQHEGQKRTGEKRLVNRTTGAGMER